MWSFKAVLVLLLVSLTGIELAHLNYHYQNCPKPQNFDKNFWSLYLIKNINQFPHRGITNNDCRSLRSLPLHRARAVLYWRSTVRRGSERSERVSLSIRIRIRSAAHLSARWAPVKQVHTTCWQQLEAVPYYMHQRQTDYAQDWTTDVRCYSWR